MAVYGRTDQNAEAKKQILFWFWLASGFINIAIMIVAPILMCFPSKEERAKPLPWDHV